MLFRKIFIVLAAVSLLLTACGGQKSVDAETTEVKITLTDFGIESTLTEFKVGVTYHFTVTNAGVTEHEFMVMPPLVEDQMGMAMDMHQLDEQALAMIPASDLFAGATATLDYTFTEATPDGTLEFACHTPGHYEANMKLPIVVK